MAQIVINEISQNYSYNIGTNSFATVALPITACWGPGYFDPGTEFSTTALVTGSNGTQVSSSQGANVSGQVPTEDAQSLVADAKQKMLERTVWQRFPATQAGLEAFVAAYRGPASCYKSAKDYSYQMAMTLLTAGYDVLVCRICPGAHAYGTLTQSAGNTITFRAKYPGTFGNNLQIAMQKSSYFDDMHVRRYFWNIITYVVNSSGVRSSVESKAVAFNIDNSSDGVAYYKDVESNFWEIQSVAGTITETAEAAVPYDAAKSTSTHYVRLASGTDFDDTITPSIAVNGSGAVPSLYDVAKLRYEWAAAYQGGTYESTGEKHYVDTITALTRDPEEQSGGTHAPISTIDAYTFQMYYYREWIFSSLVGDNVSEIDGELVGGVYDLLKDKLSYNPQRIISPGWDDQDVYMYTDDYDSIFSIGTYENPATTDNGTCTVPISPIHAKIMEVAYYSRCATGLIDVPKIVDRRYVHIEDEFNESRKGYVQQLSRMSVSDSAFDVDGSLFYTHSAFFAPWGQYTYVGTSKQNVASPSFLALMIQRAQILNQAIQYEWALPTNRKHNLRIGKMEYTVPKKVLDKWQKLEGASVNVITTIPDMGTNLWGNSTLFEVPPATYQALANLSTRYLVNAVEDCVYRCGISITFQYNNLQAYNKFFAGVTPLLDTMKNVGAIEDYRVTMSADINGLEHVNANTVLGKVWLIVNGVINDIFVDLIALPAGLGIDLNSLS